jgi:methylated-DNA-[protein]-cysteine S-methyltransferase
VKWFQVDTPLGEMSYALDEVGLCTVHFGPKEGAPVGTDAFADELRAYFAGDLTSFSVPMHVRKGTEFERAVWEQMKLIPYGETRSYGFVAGAVGEPGGAQAVGIACNRNPLPIIVPCHRIIGADGKLVGFGGGLKLKRMLLELEAKVKMQLDWT